MALRTSGVRHSMLAGLLCLLAIPGCYDDGISAAVDESNPNATSEVSNDLFASAGWTIQTVDTTAGAGAYCSLAYDPSGNPAISYSAPNSGGSTGLLKFARWNGATWTLQTVSTSNYTGNSLAFDSSGMPAIAFSSTAKSGSLRYARWNGSSWSNELVQDKAVSEHCSLVFDTMGQPSIAYRVLSGNTKKLTFARRVGSSWKKEVVDSGDVTAYHSLSYDSSGNPAIAYSYDANPNLFGSDTVKLARKSGSSWSLQVVETGLTGMGVGASLGFDPSTGHPAIFHGWANATTDAGKRFVSWSGSSWTTEVITNVTLTSSGTMAFDATGAPVVAYRRLISGGGCVVDFARRNGGVWEIEEADSSPVTPGSPIDISIRVQGSPTIAYRLNNTLRFARRDNP